MSNREERPLVQQESLRLNSDTFWFTLFQGIGHIMKFKKRTFSFLDRQKCLILFRNGNYSVANSGISFPEPCTMLWIRKRYPPEKPRNFNGFGVFCCPFFDVEPRDIFPAREDLNPHASD